MDVFNISDYIMCPEQKVNIGRQVTESREEMKKDSELHGQRFLSNLSRLILWGLARWPSPYSWTSLILKMEKITWGFPSPTLQYRCGPATLIFFFSCFVCFFIQQVLTSHQFVYTSVYTCQSLSPNSALHHPHLTAVFPPLCPYVHSLHLCLNFCPANWLICTIFLGSTYMH